MNFKDFFSRPAKWSKPYIVNPTSYMGRFGRREYREVSPEIGRYILENLCTEHKAGTEWRYMDLEEPLFVIESPSDLITAEDFDYMSVWEDNGKYLVAIYRKGHESINRRQLMKDSRQKVLLDNLIEKHVMPYFNSLNKDNPGVNTDF